MTGATTRWNLPYPLANDVPAGDVQIKALADKLDPATVNVANPGVWMGSVGTLSNRPAAGKVNRTYFATDENILYFDTGSGWIAIPTIQTGRIHDVLDMKFSARRNEHSGWIYADGRALASGVYPAARAALVADGNPFGVSGSNPLLPDMRGRAPLGAGTGAGLTARTFGQQVGAESHTLTAAQMPAHNHGGASGNAGSHNHGGATGSMNRNNPHQHAHEDGYPDSGGTSGSPYIEICNQVPCLGTLIHIRNSYATDVNHEHSISTVADHSHSVTSEGGGGSHPSMQPSTVGQWFIFAGAAS